MFGKLAYNNKNIPNDQKDRMEASKYCQIFKTIGKLIRKLNFVDHGQMNSDTLLSKLNVKRGETLNKIIKKYVDKDQTIFFS